MEKKRKRDKADQGEQRHSQPIAPTPKDNNIEEDSDTEELKQNVSRITFECVMEILLVIHPGKCPSYLSGQKSHLLTAKTGLQNIRTNFLSWVL